MREINLGRRTKAEANRIKHFMVQADKFLNHTGLLSEGHYCIGFDPGYLFSRGIGSYQSYTIPDDIMDTIIRVFEEK